MLDKINNYSDEIKPLFRLLRTEAFRFIIIQYNHHSIVKRIKDDLSGHFPDRPMYNVDGREIGYRSLVDNYYKLSRGFFLIENFEEILANPEIYAGLNQRRDKLALYPIALIVFISVGTQKLFAREIMKKMPDLWSYRSLILDLKIDNSQFTLSGNEEYNLELEHLDSFLSNQPIVSSKKVQKKKSNNKILDQKNILIRDKEDQKLQKEPPRSTIQLNETKKLNTPIIKFGENTTLEKKHELNRLLLRVNSVSSTEKKYLRIAYEQIASLLVDLWQLDDAIVHYFKLEKIELELGDFEGLGTTYNNIGLIYTQKGEFKKSLEFHLKSQEIRSKTDDKAALGTTYNNIGGVYSENGNIEKALEYYLSAEQMFLASDHQEGLGAAYNNIGSYYIQIKDWNKALSYLLKSEKIRLNCGDTIGLGATYFNLGFIYYNQKEFNLALEYFKKSEIVQLSFENTSKLREVYLQIAGIYSTIEDWEQSIIYYRKLEEIEKKLGNKIGIGKALNYIGIAASNMGDYNKAIAFHLEAEKIRYEIKDDSGIIQTLYNIGMEYLRIKQVDKAINYFVLAGYYAKMKGLDADLKQMDIIMNELFNKYGKKEFMRLGKNLYESWIKHFN